MIALYAGPVLCSREAAHLREVNEVRVVLHGSWVITITSFARRTFHVTPSRPGGTCSESSAASESRSAVGTDREHRNDSQECRLHNPDPLGLSFRSCRAKALYMPVADT